MTFAAWAIILGVLLIAMVLSGTLLKRLPLSTAMLYLAAGFILGPAGWGVLTLNPLNHAAFLERATEVAVLISLFSVGLKLGLPLSNRHWLLPLRLAFVSMTLTVALIAVTGALLLDLPLGAAVLLGAILAPTDPVLASAVQVESSGDRDRLRFSLTGEGGLNDGTAFPFVMLGLGLLGLHDLGSGGWRWLAVDVVWATSGGLLIGGVLGAFIGKLVVYLRTRHQESVGLDEFLALGLIALAYGVAVLAHAYGFLAVFAAGLALQRVKEQSGVIHVFTIKHPQGEVDNEPIAHAIHADHASAYMMQAVRGFNEQMERIGELAVVLLVGALLPFSHLPTSALGLLALLFLVIRPTSVWLGLLGASISRDQRLMMAWFGIRGIGSIYYLMYAINHGMPQPLVEPIVAITLAAVTVSIVLHGMSVRPIMHFYRKRKIPQDP
ncbi:MAG: cation:proton antiporter [Candidatus Thiodiazotropha sp. (ex Lucinoma borealis)]|nr:cation:proton antiporter [Candidatus Thiodiazotropha sp. (ex Lucinoma borealis)]MCU7866157.1 cation:proton antiporter [Candidatus Thiodiazotropha sp. (ex Lucinoma borealis)]